MIYKETINTNLIVSAFCNPLDDAKVDEYTAVMQSEMLSHNFPPIAGFYTTVSDDEIGEYFMNGEEITEEHTGKIIFKVSNGHHRTTAAINAGLPYLETVIDRACLCTEEDLKQWDKIYN